jgi:hypothetical protein
MFDDWIDFSVKLAIEPASFWSSNRKIFRNKIFTVKDLNNINLEDGGYTKAKIGLLIKYYYHEESINIAQQLWKKRLSQSGYGSVSFTCFNHLVKGGSVNAARSIRTSVFGPCLQSIVLTKIDKNTSTVDIFYRTTEIVKKFSADVVFLREKLLMPNFEIPNLKEINFHFTNLTLHPMYFPILFIHLEDPIQELEIIKKKDRKYFDYLMICTGRYLIKEFMRGILKHSQSLHVRDQILDQLPKKIRLDLVDYIYKNHPGYKRQYKGS